MKRLAVVLMLTVPLLAFGAGPDDFQATIDFDMSLSRLYKLVQDGAYDLIDPDRYMILQGSVASTTVLDSNEETYRSQLEIVGGEWVGLESISIYRVYVLLAGPEFAARVPDRPPRNPGPEVILTNSVVMVVGRFIDVREEEDGSVSPVIEAIAVR